jgi:hypothetical protein
MKAHFKGLAVVTILAILGMSIFAVVTAFDGSYAQFNWVNTVFLILGISAMIYGSWYGIKQIMLMAFIGTIFLLESCSFAKSNQQVVVSQDCGKTWQKIEAGQSVPLGGANRCFMKVVIPNFPMQGEARFITNLKGNVRAAVHIDYDYSIIDALEFIKKAKFLGKANVDPDDADAIGAQFESAENAVIDKRIKDVSKAIFLGEDIIELDQSAMEDHLFNESNKVLEKLGIRLNFITLTFDLDEQTRQSIDVATAMKIYQSKNLEDIGKMIMVAKAGATKISITEEAQKPEEKK